MTDGAEERRITYRFTLQDGTRREFVVRLDPDTLAVVTSPRTSYPKWTALSHEKCTNCPLDERAHPRCPIAQNLVDVVKAFETSNSFDECLVEVETGERTYTKRAAVQHGLAALIGIYSVTSGCPILDRLRPMVETHLPFMNPEESTYRMVAMYLMAQYFRAARGQSPDWRLDGLRAFLEECRRTNAGLVRRLQTLGVKDASLNAVAGLNTIAELVSISVQNQLARLEPLFRRHLDGGAKG